MRRFSLQESWNETKPSWTMDDLNDMIGYSQDDPPVTRDLDPGLADG